MNTCYSRLTVPTNIFEEFEKFIEEEDKDMFNSYSDSQTELGDYVPKVTDDTKKLNPSNVLNDELQDIKSEGEDELERDQRSISQMLPTKAKDSIKPEDIRLFSVDNTQSGLTYPIEKQEIADA